MRTPRLWAWISIRMITLALAAVGFVWAGASALDWWWWSSQESRLPSSVLAELHELERTNTNPQRQAEIYVEYFDDPTQRNDLLAIALLSACTLPFILWFGIAAARRLSRPLTQASDAAMKVAGGQFDVRLEPPSSGPIELRRFSDDFNTMAERLQRYERELRDSSAAIAHELRTPLTAAGARVQGMLDGVFPCDPAQLRHVLMQLETLGRLVSDLHAYSLALSGQFHLASESVGLRELVQERCDWVRPQLDAEHAVVHNAVSPDVSVWADRHRLGQVISILLDNAIRYAATGRNIEFRAGNAAPDMVQLHVLDRGPGIAPEDFPRVFDRFWRADSSRSRHAGGSGLGLAIAAAICEAHGGAIAAAPRPGGGTELVVTLPRRPPQDRTNV
jgi:signal transduction histidine kinase